MKRRDSMMADLQRPVTVSQSGISLVQFTNGGVFGGVATKGVCDAVTHTAYIYTYTYICVIMCIYIYIYTYVDM